MIRILFVCTGNLFRSKLAEALADYTFAQGGIAAEVRSAGINAVSGSRIPHETETLAHNFGIEIKNPWSRAIDRDLLHWADYVFVMERSHLEYIVKKYPEYKEKVRLLLEAVNLGGDLYEIPDPIYGTITLYEVAKLLLISLGILLEKVRVHGKII